MAHPEQQRFCDAVKARFPDAFEGVRALDVGSLDVNGTNRRLFTGGTYTGLDVGPGKNVDVVCLGHEYVADPFDTVISTECLEHDPHWKLTLANMAHLCRPGGLVVMTCATTGRQEHGTSRFKVADSPLSHARFGDYYRNLTEELVRGVDGFLDRFAAYEFSTNAGTKDLYFWGIAK